jgi:hypothetical protein
VVQNFEWTLARLVVLGRPLIVISYDSKCYLVLFKGYKMDM